MTRRSSMNRSLWVRLKQSLAVAEQWYRRTPERSLNEAYAAAQAIRDLEQRYAGGQTIRLEAQGEGAVSAYFQTQIKKHLKTIRMRLTEYKFSSPWVDLPKSSVLDSDRAQRQPISPESTQPFAAEYTLSRDEYSTTQDAVVPDAQATQAILDKLLLIDSVLIRYEPWRLPSSPPSPSEVKQSGTGSSQPATLQSVQDSFLGAANATSGGDRNPPPETKSDSSSFIPRSILKTADRFRRELDPNPDSEEEVVRNFRSSRARTRSATRFLLLLIIIPLLTQQISKAVVIGPLVEQLRGAENLEEWVNPRLEEKYLTELVSFEEKLKFQNLVAAAPLSSEEMETTLKTEALKLKFEFQESLKEPIKNIFADALSLIIFAVMIVTGRKEIAVLKTFLDELIYGLSDSAKAFIIILFTDVFVGFHSPHGWEVIIESTLDHFGLPLNQSFVNMFIATFPVMLDTVFKYWIFRYLNQISPSAVATYKNMNE